MTVTDTFHCRDCCGPVAVTLQVPDGITALELAQHLQPITFEARVLHDLRIHLDGLVGA